MKRIIFDIILFITIYIFPWWVGFLLLMVGLFYFDNFYEFIIISAIIYSLYSVPGLGVISSSVFFPSIIIILYIIVQSVKNNIIHYKNESYSINRII